jgi:hypothetical protein
MSLLEKISKYVGSKPYIGNSVKTPTKKLDFTFLPVENVSNWSFYRNVLTMTNENYQMCFTENDRVDIINGYISDIMKYCEVIQDQKLTKVLRTEIKNMDVVSDNVIYHCAKFANIIIYVITELSEQSFIEKYNQLDTFNCTIYKHESESIKDRVILFKHPCGIYNPILFTNMEERESFTDYLTDNENTRTIVDYTILV